MKQIKITRDSKGVNFEAVSIDNTENVFYTNLDPTQAHWPELSDNQVGPAPSPNSSQCPVPVPQGKTPPYQVTYKCKLHANEQGTISVFAQLAAGTTQLAQATQNSPITRQRVVQGGKPPYAIRGQQFQVTDSQGNVTPGSGSIGPGLQLTQDQTGIWVTGTPTVKGTYNFTFQVDDAMGKNLQQVQYSMKVV